MARAPQRPALVWALRSFLLLNFCSSLGFIIYAFILENPPKTALPLGLLIVGIFSLVCVFIGLIGSLRIQCCLSIYLVLGGTLTLAELALTISMFFNVDNTVNAIYRQRKAEDPDTAAAEKNEIKSQIEGGRWFFLVVCVLQVISMLVAVVLRVCIYPRERDFENFEESGDQNSGTANKGQVQMQKLQSSIGGRQQHVTVTTSPSTASYSSSRLNKSTTQKMMAKYGEYAEEYKSKGFFSRMLGR